MSYYWFNRKELFHKAGKKYHNCGGKEKAAKYYQANTDAIKEKANNKYKNLTEEEKKRKGNIPRQIQQNERKWKKDTNLFLQYKDEQTDIKI